MMDSRIFVHGFDAGTNAALKWLSNHGDVVFNPISAALGGVYSGVRWVLMLPPFFVLAVVVAVIGWRMVNAWFGLLAGLALAFCATMGLWPQTVSTLALVITATLMALAVGLPAGVITGYAPGLDNALEPALDLIQTLPPYIYLLPAIALLGYGPATALAATVIVAIPPAVRLTSLGIRMTPAEYIELGDALGITPWQMFFKIRLPFAMPSIMAGVNQSLMMAFGMVVIAGIVGSGGLGQTIYNAIRTLDIAKSIDGALAIVILTMVLDRITQSASGARAGERG